jgi:hypothetical protein
VQDGGEWLKNRKSAKIWTNAPNSTGQVNASKATHDLKANAV